MTSKVAVYGSLLSGMGNHRLLKDAVPIGSGWTVDPFTLLDLGSFPGAVPAPVGEKLRVEVYVCCPEIIERLDQLEGHPDFYRRELRTVRMDHYYTATERAWLYQLPGSWLKRTENKVVRGGDWKAYLRERQAQARARALAAQADG